MESQQKHQLALMEAGHSMLCAVKQDPRGCPLCQPVKVERKVKWGRSQDGFVESKCGRFSVSPTFRGCETAQAFDLLDRHTHKTLRQFPTQGAAKDAAEKEDLN